MIKIKNQLKLAVLTVMSIIFISSCNPTKKYEEREEAEIANYLTANPTLSYEHKTSGLYYLDLIVGTGSQPVTSDTAFIYYTGYLLDGTEFDKLVTGDAYGFPVNEGWIMSGIDEGIMLMKVGGKAKLLMPSSLAFGNTGYYFPAYTPVIYDVTLDSLVAGPNHK